jgi:uncharacterized membrane protein
MIAASGGIGGGGLLVPILILVFGFDPKHAIPLSNFTILGCSIMNVILNLSKRHPDADRPLVDWDLILVMEPLTMAGAVFGAYLSKIMPDWFLVLLLVIVLGYTSIKTVAKGRQQYKKESEAFEKAQRSALSQAKEDQEFDMENVGLLSEDSNRDLPNADDSSAPVGSIEAIDPELSKILEAEKNTPMEKVFLLVIMFVVVVFLNLIKGGGGAFHSPLGIVCGSTSYWMVTVR